MLEPLEESIAYTATWLQISDLGGEGITVKGQVADSNSGFVYSSEIRNGLQETHTNDLI